MQSIYLKILLVFLCSIAVPTAKAELADIAQIKKKLELHGQRDTAYVKLLNDLAQMYLIKSPAESKKYCTEAIGLAEGLHYQEGKIRICYIFVKIFVAEGKFAKALDYGFQGLKLSREIHNKELEALLLNVLGMAYGRLDNMHKATAYFLQAKDVAMQIDDKETLGMVYNNLGWMNAQEDPRKALDYYNQALSIYRAIGTQNRMAMVYNNIGVILHNKDHNTQEALIYFQNALAIEEMFQYSINDHVLFLGNIARAYLDLRMYEKAKVHLDQALKIGNEIGDKDNMSYIYKQYARYYQEQNDFEKALGYERKLRFLLDSVMNGEVYEQVFQLENQYQNVEGKKAARQGAGMYELPFNKAFLIILSVVLLALVLTTLLILYLQRLRINQEKECHDNRQSAIQAELEKKELELIHKNKKLTIDTLQTIQKSNLFNELKEEIGEISKTMGPLHQPQLKKLLPLLDQNLNLEKEWKGFCNTFEQVDPHFIERLQELIPGIAPKDMRLASLLRLGFSTKEIANVMNTSVDSAKVARSQLRKKLGLTRKDSLIDFIMRI